MPDIPPWLHPQSIPQMYAQGAQMGMGMASERARIQQAQAQLTQQAQIASMEIAAKQEQSARHAMVQQQQLEIEKAYKEQMISLHQQELAEKQAELERKTQEAAQQFAAQQRFAASLEQMGENPNIMQAARESGMGLPPALAMKAAEFNRVREKRPNMPQVMENYDPNKAYVSEGGAFFPPKMEKPLPHETFKESIVNFPNPAARFGNTNVPPTIARTNFTRTGVSPRAAAKTPTLPRITSQEEYDAFEGGDYIDSRGTRAYKKKRSE